LARKRKRKKEEGAEPESGFTDQAAGPQERERMTPVEIQQKVFRLAFRGYNERDVDEFLDRVTEDVAAIHEENKRLREQIAEGGGAPGGLEEAQRQAETIVRQAREHAARLMEEAEGGGAAAAVGGEGLPASFLLQERGFLQQMAGLIQDHARRLKDEARRVRASDEEVPAGQMAESAAPPPTPASSPPAPPGEPAEGGEPTAGAVAAAPEEGEEATAPWTPIGNEPESPAEPRRAPGEDADPLLSAWESAFTGDQGESGRSSEEAALGAYPVESGNRDEEEGEPSLRELFWGEE
jgi:DivIVA domain-containing protein